MMKFLLIDDSAFSRKISANYIRKYFPDASIEFASDGEMGIQKFDQTHPDYVIADLLMPKVSGKDMISILKKKSFNNIIVLSADVQKGIRQEIEAMGITAFINKPLSDETMQVLYAKIKGTSYEATK